MSGPDCEECGMYFIDCHCDKTKGNIMSEKYIDPVQGCPIVDPMQQILDKQEESQLLESEHTLRILDRIHELENRIEIMAESLATALAVLHCDGKDVCPEWMSIRNRWPENPGRYWVKDCRHNLEGWANYDGYQWEPAEFDLPKKGSLLLVHYTATHWKESKNAE